MNCENRESGVKGVVLKRQAIGGRLYRVRRDPGSLANHLRGWLDGDHEAIVWFVRACARTDVQNAPGLPSALSIRLAIRVSGRRYSE